MVPTATKREPFSAFIRRVAEEYAKKKAKGETGMATGKTAAEKSPKVDEKSQYPYKGKDNPTPKQHITKPHKGRPATDFAKDKKDYSKMYNYTAEFVGASDRRQAAWNILDGNTPLWTVTAGAAFDDMLDTEIESGVTGYDRFSSRGYGEDLIRAILENGLDETMKRVNATKVVEQTQKVAQPKFDESKLIQAAEAKAADLAEEMAEEFRIRLIEGFKVALKLQNKNQLDNPIRAIAYEVLTKHGLDGSLAEEIAGEDVVEAHFDGAMRKALEYTEMEPAAFEEVKALADSAPHTRVVEAAESSDTLLEQAEAEAIESLRRRAGRNLSIKSPTGETPQRNFDDNLRTAVRQGLRIKTPSTDGPTYQPRTRRVGHR
jgi:hypothetical protein